MFGIYRLRKQKLNLGSVCLMIDPAVWMEAFISHQDTMLHYRLRENATFTIIY